jgi:multidrug efflux pump subunit AcrA (membrane-fusion protein)
MTIRQKVESTESSHAPGENGPRGSIVLWVLIAVLLLTGLFMLGYWPRMNQARRLAADSQPKRQALPTVTFILIKETPAETVLELPGNVQAFAETALFARADGYVKQRLVDIGDRVKNGQLLAEIESPELDQQILEAKANLQRVRSNLQQAEASRSQANANLGLAKITAERWLTLVGKGVFSKQDGDEKQAALDARKADVAAAEAAARAAQENITANEASVQRLQELQTFRKVRAPFAGVVTTRNIDVGSLVSAGSSSSLRELFRIAQINTLRVFVNVPQSEVAGIKTGIGCSVAIREMEGKTFEGKVTRTANALDASSRTLPVEVQVANPGSVMLPGMYAAVRFNIHRPPSLQIPSNGFRNTAKGPMAAVLQKGDTVHLQLVKLGRDYGSQITVLGGLKAGQRLITSWSDEVKEGAKVKPVAAAKPAAPRSGGSSK